VFYITIGDSGSVVKPLAEQRGAREILKAGAVAGEIAPFRNQGTMLSLDLGFSR
jgi:hypothetical protein